MNMNSNFIISAIKENEVIHLFNLSEKELSAKGISKITVDEKLGYSCRVSLEDAYIGEEILVFNYQHHKVNSPYRSSSPVFVRFNATEPKLKMNEIHKMLIHWYYPYAFIIKKE